MNCDELKEQETTLRAQSDTLNSTIATSQNTANLQFLACLAADNKGGTYPPPLQMATPVQTQQSMMNIQTRIMYLTMLNPVPTALISQYQQLMQTLQNIYNEQIALGQTNAQLQSVLQQEIDGGC